MHGSPRRHLALLAVVLAIPCGLHAEVTIEDPGTYVVDRAGIVDASTEARLNDFLRELEHKTTAQVKILTVQTIDGEDWFGFVHRHAELWRLGQKGKDNGVLIAVAMQERKDRIHVGYGLEGVLPDSWCGTLRRQVFVPNFKAGRFSEGLYRGIVMIANAIAADAGVQLSGTPRYELAQGPSQRQARGKGGVPWQACCGLFVPLVILMLFLSSMNQRGRHYRRWGGGGLLQGLFWGMLFSNMMSGGRRSWGGGSHGGGFSGFGGGGFGGGGFGGGSFGGGGGFGGGGAGGSW